MTLRNMESLLSERMCDNVHVDECSESNRETSLHPFDPILYTIKFLRAWLVYRNPAEDTDNLLKYTHDQLVEKVLDDFEENKSTPSLAWFTNWQPDEVPAIFIQCWVIENGLFAYSNNEWVPICCRLLESKRRQQVNERNALMHAVASPSSQEDLLRALSRRLVGCTKSLHKAEACLYTLDKQYLNTLSENEYKKWSSIPDKSITVKPPSVFDVDMELAKVIAYFVGAKAIDQYVLRVQKNEGVVAVKRNAGMIILQNTSSFMKVRGYKTVVDRMLAKETHFASLEALKPYVQNKKAILNALLLYVGSKVDGSDPVNAKRAFIGSLFLETYSSLELGSKADDFAQFLSKKVVPVFVQK